MDRAAFIPVLVLCATITGPARADIYAYVNPDASLVLTNLAAGKIPASWIMRSELTPEAVSKPASPRTRDRYQEEIQTVAREYGVDMDLIHAVIATESNYISDAISPRGAIGLMQLMPPTAKRFGIVNLFDAIQNIRAGTQYLRHLLTAFDGNIELVLAAYNAGEQAVLKYGGKVPPYPETINYVRVVQGTYRGRKQAIGASQPNRDRPVLDGCQGCQFSLP
jgi:soluble lytic murein transglycosylase-like protein